MYGMLVEDERPQSPGEELLNSASHCIGLIAALVGASFLVVSAIRHGGAWTVTGAGVFAGTMALLYMASTVYHALPASKAKRVFQVLDRGAIFLLIAGTYTPFTLGVLRGACGWTLLGLIWSLAIFGVTVMAVGGIRHPRLSTGLYLVMGWLILIAVWPLWLHMPLSGLLLLLAGGIAYTGGVGFYAAKGLRHSHFVWHLFVILGTSCHFFAVLWYGA